MTAGHRDRPPGAGDDRAPVPPTVAGPAGDAPLLDASGLAVSFGDVEVVSGVEFQVAPGALVGLVGPNGAGKTTLLRAVTGAVEPDAGAVRLGGERASDLSAREVGRRVASVPQETTLGFDFGVRRVVEMGRTPHLGRFDGYGPDDAAAVDAAMAAADVERFADRSVTAVSGGERQRVLLARALAQAAPLLLLDEPTASLDVSHAVETLELVREFVDTGGRGAVAAIHDLDAAARYCDEIVVVADGGVRAAGPPRAVLSASVLNDAFGAEAFVGRGPATGSPAVTAFQKSDVEPRRVHVVGTGRPTAGVVARLAAAGHELSLGTVPVGDAAAGAAADADAPAVTVPPFESPASGAVARARGLAANADAVVAVGDTARPNAAVVDVATPLVRVDADASDRAVVDAVADATRDAE